MGNSEVTRHKKFLLVDIWDIRLVVFLTDDWDSIGKLCSDTIWNWYIYGDKIEADYNFDSLRDHTINLPDSLIRFSTANCCLKLGMVDVDSYVWNWLITLIQELLFSTDCIYSYGVRDAKIDVRGMKKWETAREISLKMMMNQNWNRLFSMLVHKLKTFKRLQNENDEWQFNFIK